MKPNVVIDEGRFKTTMLVKTGTILLHPDWLLGVAARDIQAGEILEYRIRGRRMKACTVQDIKVGQDMFWYGILPIGVAARNIPAGSIIDYKPNENTADVIATKERKNANPPQL